MAGDTDSTAEGVAEREEFRRALVELLRPHGGPASVAKMLGSRPSKSSLSSWVSRTETKLPNESTLKDLFEGLDTGPAIRLELLRLLTAAKEARSVPPPAAPGPQTQVEAADVAEAGAGEGEVPPLTSAPVGPEHRTEPEPEPEPDMKDVPGGKGRRPGRARLLAAAGALVLGVAAAGTWVVWPRGSEADALERPTASAPAGTTGPATASPGGTAAAGTAAPTTGGPTAGPSPSATVGQTPDAVQGSVGGAGGSGATGGAAQGSGSGAGAGGTPTAGGRAGGSGSSPAGSAAGGGGSVQTPQTTGPVPGSSAAPAAWVRVAGPGCSESAAHSYYADPAHAGTEGFRVSSAGGGWGKDDCSGSTQANRVPDPATSAPGDMAVWQFRPPVGRSCRAEVYVPVNSEAAGLAHYGVTPRNDTDALLGGVVTVDQAGRKGRWLDLGSFTAPADGLAIVVVGKPDADRHTIATSAARLSC